MSKEKFNSNPINESSNNTSWNFHDVVYQGDKDIEASKSENDAILVEVAPYVEKIDPKMLKKVFDGWKNRKNHYRKLMREEESMAELSGAECDVWADLFYLGTVFRDYLDTILDLKRPEKSSFQLLDSTEEEVSKMGSAMGWFSSPEHMVNIIGDRFDNKFDFLGAIAHEMWHAHQVQVIEEEDSDRSDIYQEAFRNYTGIEDPENNKNQLLEKEAYAFQYLFEQKLSEAMKLAPEMEDVLTDDGQPELDLEEFMDLIRSDGFPEYGFYSDDFDSDDDWG